MFIDHRSSMWPKILRPPAICRTMRQNCCIAWNRIEGKVVSEILWVRQCRWCNSLGNFERYFHHSPLHKILKSKFQTHMAVYAEHVIHCRSRRNLSVYTLHSFFSEYINLFIFFQSLKDPNPFSPQNISSYNLSNCFFFKWMIPNRNMLADRI